MTAIIRTAVFKKSDGLMDSFSKASRLTAGFCFNGTGNLKKKEAALGVDPYGPGAFKETSKFTPFIIHLLKHTHSLAL